MRAHNGDGGDVPVLDAVRRVFLHLGEDVADDARWVVGGLLGAGDVDGDVGELGPREGMVEVVLGKRLASLTCVGQQRITAGA
jgi:hypothetical protein